MWASRADFGKLLVQIDDLLGQAQTAEEVDALFDASAVGGKVDRSSHSSHAACA